jgi:hypothetical protein
VPLPGFLFQVAFARQDNGFVGVQKCFMARGDETFRGIAITGSTAIYRSEALQ